MAQNILDKAPAFAPNAIPTPAGWVDPVTQELLVAVKLDMAKFAKKAAPKVAEAKTEPKVEAKKSASKVAEAKTEEPVTA